MTEINLTVAVFKFQGKAAWRLQHGKAGKGLPKAPLAEQTASLNQRVRGDIENVGHIQSVGLSARIDGRAGFMIGWRANLIQTTS